ncbi:DUF4405 domain-containing protein [Desulfitobacterium metallireducens]|uniref:Flavinylation-associated cytochrome domain-containing protein n=1 Tax=Desulfitobacterium metallireducens DSM 15288 TaxID=871968 RepID=W0E6J3_9FIRM|nr:DUF4405 domain-containing protein [Desulfitobacterium metallireducens]AHF06510.1 hypothetical protein DESME_05110 [Desulfitobacterium metallireducens DSM 15288]
MLKNKNIVKLILDGVIAVAFALLFNAKVMGGLFFHESVGLGIGVGFLVHILLNAQWIKTVTLRLFDRKLPGKARLGYFLNILLFIAMIAVIVSGFMISKIIFPGFRAVDQHGFKALHLGVSYLTLIIVGVHVGLHWQWIAVMMKKVFKVQSTSLMRVLARVALALVIFFGGFQILDTQVAPQISQSGTTMTSNSRQIPPEGIEGKFKGELEGKELGRGKLEAVPGGEFEERDDKLSTSSSAGTILRFSGIIGFFALITYFVEKLQTRKMVRI